MSIQKGTRENMSRVLELVRTTKMQPQIPTMKHQLSFTTRISISKSTVTSQLTIKGKKKKFERGINLYF